MPPGKSLLLVGLESYRARRRERGALEEGEGGCPRVKRDHMYGRALQSTNFKGKLDVFKQYYTTTLVQALLSSHFY